MAQKRTGQETRTLIFEACSQILRLEGLTSLTLDAVAEEAGLSKGGLFYHFPNKAALIEALFEYHNNIFEERLQELTKAEGNDSTAWLRAYAKASIEQIVDPDNAKLYASLFAAEEQYASAHQLMRDKYINWQQQIDESNLDPAWATLIRLTVDGLWFSEMHQYAPPSAERRQEIVALLFELTEKIADTTNSS
ncbi:MAG: TetR/AcrR family transcriptional regulator [Chloroflexota bacterium]